MQHPLIEAGELLAQRRAGQPWVVLDCGFDLFDAGAGALAWSQGHIPGAHYAHLETALSGPKSPRGSIEGGRHPLPHPQAWARTMAAWGITPEHRVVAYDDQGGPFAARAWWLLRAAGVSQAMVLNGGKAAWLAAGGALEAGLAPAPGAAAVTDMGADGPSKATAQDTTQATAVPDWPGMPTIDAASLSRQLGRQALVDARAPERYRGETEPLDAQAGHIPGALNRFFKLNLGPDGRFKSAEQLRAEWVALVGDAEPAVHQCGSGVTACHNLLAATIAGLPTGVLYPGSWSEWSADPNRPVAVG